MSDNIMSFPTPMTDKATPMDYDARRVAVNFVVDFYNRDPFGRGNWFKAEMEKALRAAYEAGQSSRPTPAPSAGERDRLAEIIDDLATDEHNYVVSPPPGTLSPEVIAHCRKLEADYRTIARLIRDGAAPRGIRAGAGRD